MQQYKVNVYSTWYIYNFGQGLNGSKVSFERSQNMLYSLKANKNHIEEDHISLARPYHNGLNFFLNNLEENNYKSLEMHVFLGMEKLVELKICAT